MLFANRAKGIFKPRQMSAALSIKTTVPRSGRSLWYRDQSFDAANLDGATGLLGEPGRRRARASKPRTP